MQETHKLTDEQLVVSYANGDNSAFDKLLLRHKSQLFNYIFQMVRDRDVADDIFQETFIKVITTIKQGRYNDMGKFTAWITRIARNLVIDYFRSEKNETTVSSDNDEYDILNRKDLSEETIEDILIDMQIENDIRNLVSQLPEPQQEVLNMRYYKDLSFKEIAEILDVSINTALGRMRYAILNLRRMIKERDLMLTR